MACHLFSVKVLLCDPKLTPIRPNFTDIPIKIWKNMDLKMWSANWQPFLQSWCVQLVLMKIVDAIDRSRTQRQNGRHFTDDNLKHVCQRKCLLKVLPKDRVTNKSTSIQMLAWRQKTIYHHPNQWWLVIWRKYAPPGLGGLTCCNEWMAVKTYFEKNISGN